MKILKYIYRILYCLIGIGLAAAVTQGILHVFHNGGTFRIFDSAPYYGAGAYFWSALIYAFLYSIELSVPLLIAVILHFIYHIRMEKIKNKAVMPAGDES
ncbi:MAG: hypothetical protein IJ644_02590 [Oscillospiraceae bacterium]|nr:hypothetical protein [Oscillospiraceae bacterium]